MDIMEIKAALDGRQYRSETTKEIRAAAKAAGVVIIYGASDDLMEIEGAVDDEVGVGNQTEVPFTPSGLLENDCDSDDCPHYARAKAAAAKVVSIFDPGDGLTFKYETAIPHETFRIMEDDEPYCDGILFKLSDVPA